jgi:hypothetical protein
MAKELLSIIIPCYNDHLYLDQAINSAYQQTYDNKEIIVVDDGSNFTTKEIIKKIEHKIDLLISQENSGVSNAKNNGVKAASGKYILIHDSDDYFEPTFAEKAIEILRCRPEIKNVTCHARWFWNDKNFKIFIPEGGNIHRFLLFNASIGNSIFTKSRFLEINGFDENMEHGYEDWEFFIRLHKDGGDTYVIPEVLFHYRKKGNSRSTRAANYKFELLEYIYLKHQDLYVKNYNSFIKHLLHKIKIEEVGKNKNRNSLEFQIGKAILRPLRKIKNILSIFKN